MPQFCLNNPSTTTPIPLTAAPTHYQWVNFIACKGLAGPTAAPNTGKVYLGFSPTAANQPMELAPGATLTVLVGAAQQFDFSQIYLGVLNAGDGICAFYL
jgi:hypothetical protein